MAGLRYNTDIPVAMYSEGNNVTDAKIYSDICEWIFWKSTVCTQMIYNFIILAITQTHKSTKSISAIIWVIQCLINRYIRLFNQKHI